MRRQTDGRSRFRLWFDRVIRRNSRRSGPRPFDWRRTLRRRVIVAGCGFAIWIAGIEARLVHLQVVDRSFLADRARDQHQRVIELHPKRGEVVDRHGRVLAYSVDADTIYAVPAEVENPAETAAALCRALDDCTREQREGLAGRLGRRNAFAYVKRRATPDEARRVAELGLSGVGFLTENRRYYPNAALAAHVLGYVGTDNQGLAGIESTYDSEISGDTGQVLVQTDARSQAFSRIERPPTVGATIELTIDAQLQHVVERELRAGIERHNADAGAVVMLDPRNGDILALASEPTFNPNAFAEATPQQRRNRAVQDLYEPGSTFKVVTASAAIEERVVERDEVFDVSAGYIVVAGDRIPDFRRTGPLTFEDVIVRSSNVGAIQVGLRLGPERLSRYVRRYGFGQALSADFPSESSGLVWTPESLTDRAIASIAMGYQVAVTPLQVAAAVGAVANGGDLIAPRLVRAVVRPDGRDERERRVIRRAISRQTAAELTDIMRQVVERGTARNARVPGYTIAGKTGTAEKLIDGVYSHYDHNASFVGFAPVEDPRFVMLVMIDTPRSALINGVVQRVYTGGAVAAPIFRRIASEAFRRLDVPATGDGAAPIVVANGASSDRRPAEQPSAGPPRPVSTGRWMPDLRGLSAREVAERLAQLDLGARIVGNGVVAGHEPAPGTAIEAGGDAIVWLARHAPSLPDGPVVEP